MEKEQPLTLLEQSMKEVGRIIKNGTEQYTKKREHLFKKCKWKRDKTINPL